MKLKNVKTFFTNPVERFNILSSRGILNFLSDESYIKKSYKINIGKELNLEEPRTFNEKLQWLKLHDRKALYTTLVDKYEVKKYVADIIGEEYVIPTYGVWNSVEEVDFEMLPNRFVLKCTHDSGGVAVVKDKSKLDLDAIKQKLSKRLKRNYFYSGREWAYKNVRPRIIAEQYLECGEQLAPDDYKFLCFDGEEKIMYVASERFEKEEKDEKTYQEKLHTLRVSSLFKSFGKKQVVKGVEFSMHTGEVVGLLGPNGAGKTTTFYMIVGFYKPTNGEIFLDEECITPLPMYKRAQKGISYLPQEPSVFRKLTVEENIWSILETRKDLSKKQKKIQLEELIEEFAIGRIRKQQAYTLSGGERRRTEIARSLAIEPKFLLLDEPFAGIDPIAVADIKNMIRQLSKRGIGILITDHNVRDTLEITDRALIISTGQLLVQGNKEDILASPQAREIY